jgi:hypothetical protein
VTPSTWHSTLLPSSPEPPPGSRAHLVQKELVALAITRMSKVVTTKATFNSSTVVVEVFISNLD